MFRERRWRFLTRLRSGRILAKNKMKHTPAAFKLQRETVGCSQQHLADLLDIGVLQIKLWEKPDGKPAPDTAWRLLEALMIEHETMISTALEQIHEQGSKDQPITLMYYRDKNMFAAQHPVEDADGWQMANTRIRDIVARLTAEGYEVNIVYPTE